MTIKQGICGNWFAVWEEPNAGDDHLHHFPGALVACFGQFGNALQLTFNA